MKRVLVIGHSHLVALQQAHIDDLAHLATDRPDLEIDFIRLFRVPPGETVERFGLDDGQRAQIADGGYDLIASAVGGSGHVLFGLANHPVQFDFVLPEEPDLPLLPEADVLPAATVAKSLGAPNTHAFFALKEIREASSAPMIQLEAPPPVPGTHVVEFPGGFKDVIAQRGVAPDMLRYKLWRLNSRQYRDFCIASGIDYVESPPEFRDANGMLAKAAWNEDPTHANPSYGACVLARIAARIPAPVSQ